MKIPYLCLGKIVEIEKNSQRKRLKVNIPAIAEPTNWLTPLNSFSYIPKINDSIGVLFLMGNIQRGFYLPLSVYDNAYMLEGSNKKAGYESKDFKIVINQEETQEKVEITAKNGLAKVIVYANGTTEINSNIIQINGDVVTIAGRLVVPNGKPIE